MNLATVYTGIAFVPTSIPGSGHQPLFQWSDSVGNAVQVSFQMDSTGAGQFFQGSGTGTPLGSASASGLFFPNLWYFLEFKITFNGSTGTVECRLNGNATPIITASGLNTAPSGNNFANRFLFVSGGNFQYDEWYMLDNTGSAPVNTYLGNGRCQTDAPTSDATPNQFTSSNGQTTGNHFHYVNQLPFSSDANFCRIQR